MDQSRRKCYNELISDRNMPRIDNDYAIKAHERSHELPHRGCNILEDIFAVRPDGGYVHPGTNNVTAYLLRLCFVADAWKKTNPHGLKLEEKIDGTKEQSIDAIIRSRKIADTVEHDLSRRDLWQQYRNTCLEKFDQNNFLELEELLGIDSGGVNRDDENPFLGADINRIGAASTYCESIVVQKEARMRVLQSQQATRDHSEKAGVLNLPELFEKLRKWLLKSIDRR